MGSGDLLRQLVKASLLPFGLIGRDRRPGVTILVYHRVGGDTLRQLNLPIALFEWQMEYLSAHCHVIGLDDVVRIAQEGRVYGHDVVVITFDDGYEDVYHQAFPILLRHRLPAIAYLATVYVEDGRPFPSDPSLANGSPHRPLSWAQAREMLSSGLVTFGAHTHTHADLTTLSQNGITREIEEANRLIRDRLGRRPIHFAYPWGRVSPLARVAVDHAYHTAVVGGTRKNPYGMIDLRSLQRVPIQRSDGRPFFRLKLGSYLFAEEWLRGRGRRGTITHRLSSGV